MVRPLFILSLCRLDVEKKTDFLPSVTPDQGRYNDGGQRHLMPTRASRRNSHITLVGKEDKILSFQMIYCRLIECSSTQTCYLPSFHSPMATPPSAHAISKRANRQRRTLLPLCEKNLIISHSSAFSSLT